MGLKRTVKTKSADISPMVNSHLPLNIYPSWDQTGKLTILGQQSRPHCWSIIKQAPKDCAGEKSNSVVVLARKQAVWEGGLGRRITSLRKQDKTRYIKKKAFNLFLYLLCALVFCLHVYLFEGVRTPGVGVTDSGELPCGCWDLNPVPSLLITEPSLQAPK